MIKLKLKEQMDKQNMSISTLVNKSIELDKENEGIHRNTISKLLNGKSNGIQFKTLDLLCKSLECDSIIELIEYTND